MVQSALSEAWTLAVSTGGRPRARSALRRRLILPLPAAEAACLLDLADAHALWPLTAAECAGRARSGDPGERHAALRYLSGIPGGRHVLPRRPHSPSDPYELLLLSAAWERCEPGTALGADFRRAVRNLPARPGGGLVAAQSMLMGQLGEPGVGLSGGMSVLIAGLGDAMAQTDHVSRVLTVVLMDSAGLHGSDALVQQLGTGHWAIRIPVPDAEAMEPATAIRHRAAISWWSSRLLELPGAAPDLLHARFADDSSLAMADAARRCGSRFVFTVTPDPHRTMAERHHGVPVASGDEPASALRLDLHKIFVGDRLVARSDLLVTIPSRTDSPALSGYFPELAKTFGARRIAAPPEGIPPFVPGAGDDEITDSLMTRLFCGGSHPEGIDHTARAMRLILNVGRLHPVKQQDLLVEAWLESGLHRSTTILLIGGSGREASTHVEREMRARISKLLSREPDARRHIAIWPALPNRHVRILERALASGRWTGPALYVCPSTKEEFGLALLEAMDSGLAAAGPLRGGVSYYIEDGVNGFLLPTDSVGTLADRLTKLLGLPSSGLADIAAAGQKSVTARFSASAMAESLAAEYHELMRASPYPRQSTGRR
ncbi:glycosyltransferase [Kitasatospora sp. NPDC049285]|uniref:glycosyltransferase n=1 Tax=Kitasatospora sp. NPDC049285 TaxID=3157096 RepID=UPI003433276B